MQLKYSTKIETYDVVYIKGNPSSGRAVLHENMDSSIIEIIKEYKYIIVGSEHNNSSHIKIPEARVYIGFSRGSRYLRKLDSSSLKVSIGGISGSKIDLFRNKKDNILSGDISPLSMEAHFIISNDDKLKIKQLISNFLKAS